MSTPKVADIVRATAAVYGITVDELRGEGAAPREIVSDARMVATYVARKTASASHRLICEAIGERPLDTGNSVNRARKCAARLADDYDLRTEVAAVMARLATAAVAAPLPAPNPATPSILREVSP